MPRLYCRIYLHFLGVLFVVGLAASVVFAIGQRGAFQRQVTERADATRRLAGRRGRGRPGGAGPAARAAPRRPGGGRDRARSRTGRLLAAAGSELCALTPAELAELRAGRCLPAGAAALVWRRPPIPRPAARSSASSSSPAPRHFRMPDLWRPGLGVVLVLLIVALAAAPLARRIARPVERLTEGARRLGRGELAYRVPRGPAARPRASPAPASRRARPSSRARSTTWPERVERLVAGQKELLANVSHELRSPLARIRVALALLPREGETDAPAAGRGGGPRPSSIA